MTRIYYDTEFLDTGHSIEGVSIGLVAGEREYYAINGDMPQASIYWDKFLRPEVIPHLPRYPGPVRPHRWLDPWHPDVKPRQQIAAEVYAFITSFPDPELWGDWSAFDHVGLSWLAGRPMMELPPGVPDRTNDLQQEVARLGNPPLPEQTTGRHHALHDARHNQQVGDYLEELANKRITINGRLYEVIKWDSRDGNGDEEAWMLYARRLPAG
ncbi:3'-5' exoribonuclease [Nonomuraea turkmeniaca]|uniref:3'-5' exoribonuclease n=1 Tax=Nonomuraea turkmeniaca TaxID=103838 RepID=A0A5S4F4C1_9ACTN|nr:3'-5' exoribonuclease [Nonomuraea turkmeniaca]TMR10987.1 3'-5' exoribonuclease [Nonomuraea turkmeniaca]